jgi:hypothetical protein
VESVLDAILRDVESRLNGVVAAAERRFL